MSSIDMVVDCIALQDYEVRAVIGRLTTTDVDKLWIFTFREFNCLGVDVSLSLVKRHLLVQSDVDDVNGSPTARFARLKNDFIWWETLTFGNDHRVWSELLVSIGRVDLLKLIDKSSSSSNGNRTSERRTTYYPLECRLLLKLYNSMNRESERTFRRDVEGRMNTTAKWISTRLDGLELRDCSLGPLLRLCFADSRGIEELEQIFRARSSDASLCYKDCAKSVHLFLHGSQYVIDTDPAGLCVIVNIKEFEGHKDWERIGSEHDLEKLQRLFEQHGYLVKPLNDCTRYMLKKKLNEFSKQDHSNYSAFVCILMSHGEKDKIICSDGRLIDVKSEIIEQFNGEKCPSLKGKPKLFFIQACRKSDSFIMQMDGSDCSSPSTPSKLRNQNSASKHWAPIGETHDDADILVSYATVEGSPALREASGSPYVNELVQHIRELGSKEDISEILMKVNGKASNCIQQPTFTSSLHKKFKFNLISQSS